MIHGLHDIPIEVILSAITREAFAKARAKVASQCEGLDFIGLDDRRQTTTIARGPDRREANREPVPTTEPDAPILDPDDDTDWYALSNGLSCVMSDGTRVGGDFDADG